MGDHLTFHFRTVCFWVLLHRQLDHCFAHIIPVTRKARSRLENLGSEVFSAQILRSTFRSNNDRRRSRRITSAVIFSPGAAPNSEASTPTAPRPKTLVAWPISSASRVRTHIFFR